MAACRSTAHSKVLIKDTIGTVAIKPIVLVVCDFIYEGHSYNTTEDLRREGEEGGREREREVCFMYIIVSPKEKQKGEKNEGSHASAHK